ncbi:branched-chain amino acid ABC transporter substrate-binding protein [Duganella sp. LjRoot269]|jgi:branched-chain amino acid transport system substrate-binding protein|uniref:branched-chain amino acid ABC transporter substrate-binding protein n=1 Tax=Duganella sp. LjRoot269 TaxID=3342305 RepID=UPI003ECC857E
MRLTTPLLILLPVSLACLGAQAQEVVRIGSASPVSGPSAHLGKDTENGARMAVEDLNAAGFTIAGKKVQLVLVAEDDGGDPKQGTAVAQQLVDAGVAGVVGHLNSGTTVPASRIYNAAGIPQITPSATTPQYTHQGFKGAFRLVASDSKVGAALGRYAVTTLKAQRIAVIDDRTAFGQGLADEFIRGVKAAGGADVVSRQYTNDRATDFNAILTQIKGRQPDVVFYGGMDAVAGPLLKQMKSLGINARFMGGDGICSERLGELSAGASGDNLVTCAVAGGVTGAQEKGYADFVARYQQRYKLTLQTYAPYAYDAVMVLATAMRNAGSADPRRYLPELAKVRYRGVTGDIAFDANGDLADAAMTIYTYRGGRKTKLDVVR